MTAREGIEGEQIEIHCCVTCEAQLSEHTFKSLAFYFTGLMVPASDGQSQRREREQQTDRPSRNIPPLSLSSTDTDQKGTPSSS